ncbi:DUF4124 domain-containing protein [Pseudothauera nasutitermitis]|uniref:DUF4124 domain-containing protein n=1 Tax=Pseudothauera nasutitermitis TaxID=2565930 RepID=A0A4S4B1N7_9RHOO|nr:DUF4124 domain-containing protein [Pseudothauera nasutitermitis]THF66436.1 DUF4124 domain-containing protein [Pseudothauera nasutitermitis]
MTQKRPAPFAVPALLGALLALVFATAAQAQIYTWKDRDGRVHYSDTPPPAGEVKTMGPARRTAPPPAAEAEGSAAGNGGAEGEGGEAPVVATPPPANAQDDEPTLAERELEFRQRRAAEEEARAKAEEESRRQAERSRACEQARNQLAALQSGQRVARFNAKGEREFMDDATRAAEIQRAQEFVSAQCN